jgi:hypothetical protein
MWALAGYKFSAFLQIAEDEDPGCPVVFWGLIAQSLPAFSLKRLS